MNKVKTKKITNNSSKRSTKTKAQKKGKNEQKAKKFLTDGMINGKKIDFKINMIIDVKDSIAFAKQDDIFLLFKSETKPNQVGLYPIKNSNFAIWTPKFGSKDKKWDNIINPSKDTITERPDNKKQKKDGFRKGLFRIVFAKFKNDYKFIGVFIEHINNGKDYIYKKVSSKIILQ